MYLKSSYSDLEKGQWLIDCLTESQNPASLIPPLPEDLQTKLAEQAVSFRDAVFLLQDRREAYGLKNDAFRELQGALPLIRHALDAVKRRAQLGDLPSASAQAFGLLTSLARTTQMVRLREPIELAQRILTANQAAVAAGTNVLIDPAPETLQANIDALTIARQERALARAAERAIFEDVKAARSEVDILMGQIKSYLRLRFQGQPAANLRDAMRAYGFRYIHESSAAADVDADIADNTGREPETADDSSEAPADTDAALVLSPFSEADDLALDLAA